MQYDPVKRRLGVVFNRTPGLRRLFYRLLDLLLLRAWHVHKELRKWERSVMVSPSNHDTAGHAAGEVTLRPLDKARGRLAQGDIHVYDAGAGFGQYTYWISARHPDWSVLALDVKEEQVADCNAFFQRIDLSSVRFEVGDVTKYVAPASYDLVVCVDVMEHVEEDEKAMANYAASLKPDGMLIISTPSDQGGSDVHGEGESSFIEEHVRDGYNIGDIEAKLLRNGFSRVEARYSYGAPGKISWRLSMKWPLLMLSASKLFFLVLPFYYLVAYPVAYLLNWLDVSMTHRTGTGLIVKAWK